MSAHSLRSAAVGCSCIHWYLLYSSYIVVHADTISCLMLKPYHVANYDISYTSIDRNMRFSLIIVLLSISYRPAYSSVVYVSLYLLSGRKGRSRQSSSISRSPRFFHVVFNHVSVVHVPNFSKGNFKRVYPFPFPSEPVPMSLSFPPPSTYLISHA